MKILLATGIYPPELGGPATYVRSLAREFKAMGNELVVISFGHSIAHDSWPVFFVSRWGGPILRWVRYACALKKYARDADLLIAFSLVSTGIPVMLARLKKPKKILRLGGDFFWERSTDRGGMLTLREWYDAPSFVTRYSLLVTRSILRVFDHVVFSTRYEEVIYERHVQNLPSHSVIENAFPASGARTRTMQLMRMEGMCSVFRLLFLGRFVGFKNLPALLQALRLLSAPASGGPRFEGRVMLTLVGSGPMQKHIEWLIKDLHLGAIVKILPPAHGAAKANIFAEHDLLVIPSLTELSPNAALEARAIGLPVLLTTETGLSHVLTHGMLLRPMRTPEEICTALGEAKRHYRKLAESAMADIPKRTYRDIAEAFISLASCI